MIISLALLFVMCMTSSFFEERLLQKHKVILYVLFGIAMVLITGLREVGVTPDSDAYEIMYTGGGNVLLEELVEPSFTFIAGILKSFSLGINALFITYALISIAVHLPILWKMSRMPLVTLTIYISYYYMMHEMVQIRAGVAAGFFLWSIYFYVEKRKMAALGLILIGTLFHYSAAAGLLLFVLSDRLPLWQKIVLYLLVPVGLIAYFTHLDLSQLLPEELVGDRLILYRELKDKGLEEDQAGWPLEHNMLIWLNIILYYACIYYSELLTKYCKYVPIAIKIQAIGFCFLFFANGISAVLGNRMNDFFSVANIILWTASAYAFYPRIAGITISSVISTGRFVTSMLAYALSLLYM